LPEGQQIICFSGTSKGALLPNQSPVQGLPLVLSLGINRPEFKKPTTYFHLVWMLKSCVHGMYWDNIHSKFAYTLQVYKFSISHIVILFCESCTRLSLYYPTNVLNYHRFLRTYLKALHSYMIISLTAQHQGEHLPVFTDPRKNSDYFPIQP
jgi:hypothetical protein